MSIPETLKKYREVISMSNLLLATDAYKGSHFKLFPPESDAVRYYIAPRKPMSPSMKEFVFFGISSFINDYLKNSPNKEDIEEAREIWDKFNVGGGVYPFPFKSFELMNDLHGQAYKLPINIYGLPEGAVSEEYNVPVAIVECFNKDFKFLPDFIETAFQRSIWYGSTVATLSRNVRKYLETIYAETVDPEDYWSIDFRLHDFRARGVSSAGSASDGGLAHLINFKGSDTMEAIKRGVDLYGIKVEDLGCSIPASEHSTVTSFGKGIEAEKKALVRMIETYGPTSPLIAFVSDSYDYKRMVDEVWGDPEIQNLARSIGTMPVVRPDSGDPVEMVLYALNSLEKSWGVKINNKGFKVLDGISVIQRDGMDFKKITTLYKAVIENGFSPQNVAVGMGGGLLQKINRDTMSWSMKMYQIRKN